MAADERVLEEGDRIVLYQLQLTSKGEFLFWIHPHMNAAQRAAVIETLRLCAKYLERSIEMVDTKDEYNRDGKDA